MFIQLLICLGVTILSLAAICLLLHVLPRLGRPGRWISGQLCQAPGLDVVVTLLTVAPLIGGAFAYGWAGLVGGYIGQWLTLIGWTLAHERANPQAIQGPRIVKINNTLVGVPRNLAALWVTSIVVPVFWIVRMAELFVYPFLIWLVRFPSYKQRDWVNVSRHKFTGLVGHDRIWCLYCDWMTGVWSLGSEMLRNVESFWCPIRFRSDLKCDNCHHDFPDVVSEWVPASSNMADVAAKLEQRYLTDKPEHNSWFGHPVRLTVKGIIPEHTSPPASIESAGIVVNEASREKPTPPPDVS